MYTINGKELSIEEVLSELRDTVRCQPVDSADVEVFVTSKEDAGKVKSYANMSGLDIKVTRKDEGYLLTIKGGSCRCI